MLALAAIGVSVIKLFFFKVPGAPRSRANTMALGIVRPSSTLHTSLISIPFLQPKLTSFYFKGAKSLIIIAYQLLTEHTQKCKRWASLKANMILNSLEVVFWAAVVFMIIQANLKFCVGTSCIVSWVVCVLGGILRYVLNFLSYIDRRE
jgi:hypothetical protein